MRRRLCHRPAAGEPGGGEKQGDPGAASHHAQGRRTYGCSFFFSGGRFLGADVGCEMLSPMPSDDAWSRLSIGVGGRGLRGWMAGMVSGWVLVVVSGAAGLLMAGYEVVRFVMIGHFDWFYEFSFVFGLAIFGLAAYLWMTEYRSHHFPARQGSSA